MITCILSVVIAVAGSSLKLPPRLTEFSPASGLLEKVRGVVVSVNGDATITIVPDGQAKAKSYPLHDHLKAGRHQPKASAGFSYHTGQLQKGDVVSLHTYGEWKATYCVDIQIWKRPGGLVPMSPADTPGQPGAYHDMRNQQIAREARGVPKPFRPAMFDLLPPEFQAKILANIAKEPPPREPPTNIVPPPRKINR